MKHVWQVETRRYAHDGWGLNAQHSANHTCGGYWSDVWFAKLYMNKIETCDKKEGLERLLIKGVLQITRLEDDKDAWLEGKSIEKDTNQHGLWNLTKMVENALLWSKLVWMNLD